MEIDWNVVRTRFSAMPLDELLEEVALRVDDYAPLAQRILEGEALARGITATQIEAKRSAESSAAEAEVGIDVPALITSSDEKDHIRELAKILRERNIPAVLRELDPNAFHASGHRVGRWGLMVSGLRAADATRVLEATIPPAAEETVAAGCSGGCACAGGDCAAAGDEWPEDGDWWQTPAGDEDPQADQR